MGVVRQCSHLDGWLSIVQRVISTDPKRGRGQLNFEVQLDKDHVRSDKPIACTTGNSRFIAEFIHIQRP